MWPGMCCSGPPHSLIVFEPVRQVERFVPVGKYHACMHACARCTDVLWAEETPGGSVLVTPVELT